MRAFIRRPFKKNYNISLRPHPEHFNISINQINQIKTKFGNYNNFSIEENINQFDSINKSDLLITDHSGISIEYILIFKKPVIFINSAEKINNPDYGALDIKTLESTVREYFGYDISPKNLVKLNSLIEEIDLKKF